jgi:DNA polymerase I-like protein with 3'-5' exonuclease and polymerase domains
MIAVDTEGTGLNLWGGDKAIGISVYTPSNDSTYYIPFGHGTGTLGSTPFSELVENGASKATKDYKLAMQDVLYRQTPYYQDVKSQNVPRAWLDELKAVWTVPALHIYHNAQFDLTALAQLGFPAPARVVDTMVLAHVIFQGWHKETFLMPDGTRETGSKGLKWLARYYDLPGAAVGEDALHNAMRGLQRAIHAQHDKVRDAREAALKAERARITAAKRAYGISSETQKRLRKQATQIYKAYHTKITDSAALSDKAHMWALKPSDVALYAELDTHLTFGLFAKLLPIVAAWDNVAIANTINDVQYQVAWRMHMTGFRLDVDEAQAMRAYADEEMTRLEQEAFKLTQEDINMNSSQQILEYMERHGYHLTDTEADTLAAYADKVPLIGIIVRYKRLSKYVSGYVDKWLETAQHTDGRIHPEFNVTGTVTGRWSSASKYVNNLQNIPRGTAGRVNPKALLKPLRDDWILIELDYSSLESRVGAWIAETLLGFDPDYAVTNLIEGGADMHAYTRDKARIANILLGGVAPTPGAIDAYIIREGLDPAATGAIIDEKYNGDKVAWFMSAIARAAAKQVNFSVQYGAGVRSIKKQLGVSDAAAQDILDGWRRAYTGITKATRFYESLALRTREVGGTYANFVRYPDVGFGTFTRRYDLYSVEATTKHGGVWSPMRNEARKTFNSVVQGTSGLIMTHAALRVSQAFGPDVLHMHASVHDSIIVSMHPSKLAQVRDIMMLMADYPTRPVLEVGIEAAPVGQAWGHKREVKDLHAWITSEGTKWK